MSDRFRGAFRRRSSPRSIGSPESQWFWDHYEWAAGEIVSFCEACELVLTGLDIADVGCGDGIMALGLRDRVRPRKLVGFDVVPTNLEALIARGRAEGVVNDALPAELEFRQSAAENTPGEDGEFDFVYSWSAFEHIAEPIEVLSEIRRILRPGGHFFLQLWPFYFSAKGSHLWEWFDEDFHHLVANDRDIVAQLAASDEHAEKAGYMSREFERLNRVTLEELQRAVLAAGFDVRRLELLTAPTLLTPALARYSWCDLGIGGIKFLATPRA